jgi:hypothetical protein
LNFLDRNTVSNFKEILIDSQAENEENKIDQVALNIQAMQKRIKKQPKKRERLSNKELNYSSIFDNNLT